MIAGEAIGLFVGACICDKDEAVATLTVVSAGMLVLGGALVDNMNPAIQAIRFLSPFHYAHGASSLLMFSQDIPCDGSAAFCSEGEYYGTIRAEDVLAAFNVEGSLRFNVGLLILWGLAPRFLAYVALRCQKHTG